MNLVRQVRLWIKCINVKRLLTESIPHLSKVHLTSAWLAKSNSPTLESLSPMLSCSTMPSMKAIVIFQLSHILARLLNVGSLSHILPDPSTAIPMSIFAELHAENGQ